MNQILWHLLAGTRGGMMRARILLALRAKPMNAHQLAKLLAVDYKTVQHHLGVLLEHRVLTVHGRYGATHFLSDETIASWKEFREIWAGVGKTQLKEAR